MSLAKGISDAIPDWLRSSPVRVDRLRGPGEVPAQESPSASSADERRLEGTLEYRELPTTQSVEAYLGVEFVLTDAQGVEHVLAPSETTSHDDLAARSGQRVIVTGRWVEPTPPDPESSYPTGPDGAPLERPGRYRVVTLEAAGS